MYTTQRRYSDHEYFQGIGQMAGLPRPQPTNIHFWSPRYVEGVYSWRTGVRAVSDPPESAPQRSGLDGWGIHTPQKSGSLVDRLSSRKRYIEEVQRAAFPAETASGSVSTNRVSTTDSGHLFASFKASRTCVRGHVVTNNWGSTSSVPRYRGDVWYAVSGIPSHNSPYTFGFPRESTDAGWGSNASQRQGLMNRYFASTAPDRAEASLGVTLVELLRGEIPSVLKNFRRMMDDMQSVHKTLGSDYLNIVFGWTPLIQEAANLIKIGMSLERAIYYESFRRKRQWEGPSVRQPLNSATASISMLNGPYLAGTFPRPGDVTGPSGGISVKADVEGEWFKSEDYHFSSKYTGLAKPTLRANSHSDRVLEIVKRLGLVDDPRFLWDLMPYSWLVDWFTTMGDSVSNASVYAPKTGKYAIDYAYTTTQQLTTASSRIVRVRPATSLKFVLQSSSSYLNQRVRWRDRATPFGFGTQMASLNAGQYAILVALGLARTR